MSEVQDLDGFLASYKLSRCLQHLLEHNITTLEDLQKIPSNDLKAIGFLPEVRTKLQRALAGQEPKAGENEEEAKVVTVEEEEEEKLNAEQGGGKGGGKKKKRGKGANKTQKEVVPGDPSKVPVPGEGGVAMDPALLQLLTTLGLERCVPVFQRNNITALSSCRYVTRQALVDNLTVPEEKAGLLLSHILASTPGAVHDRRLPELAPDLFSLIADMKLGETAKEQVRTSLQTNNVLTVPQARSKRFAMMNEVGLTADAATELGRLLDKVPLMPVAQPSHQAPYQLIGAPGMHVGGVGGMAMGPPQGYPQPNMMMQGPGGPNHSHWPPQAPPQQPMYWNQTNAAGYAAGPTIR